jgi:uncharacterized RDD family membrane protein YckC
MTIPRPTSGVNDRHHPSIAESTGRTKRFQRSDSARADRLVVLDNTIRVTTPENIAFEYQLAGPFRRLFAYLLDLLITVTGFGVFSFLVFLLMSFVVAPLAQLLGLQALFEAAFGAVVGLLFVVYFLVYWFYGAFFETYFNGQTLGKRSTGLRVLSVNGHAIDGVQATLRNFFRLLDAWPAVSVAALVDVSEFDSELEMILRSVTLPTFLIALTMMCISRKFQRVGDMVADTVVVIDTQANRPSLIKFSDPRVASLADLIPKNFLPTNHLAKAIASYVDLRRSIHPQRANEIAAHVAIPLLKKFGIPSDTDYDLFICALYYKTFIDSRSTPDETAETAAPASMEGVKQTNFLPTESLTQLRRPATASDVTAGGPFSSSPAHQTDATDTNRGQP